MLLYLVKRLLYFIPTVLLIMLLTFFISIHTPGDPVQQQLRPSLQSGPAHAADYWQAYNRQRQKMDLHLPVFYFSFTRHSIPDTLHRIAMPGHRQMLRALLLEYGNWAEVEAYFHALQQLYMAAPPASKVASLSYAALHSSDIQKIHTEMDALQALTIPELRGMQAAVAGNFEAVQNNATRWKNYVPALHWHDTGNQFHRWLFGNSGTGGGILRGDLGYSYRTQQPVIQRLTAAIGITLQLTIIALLLAFLMAIPLGVVSAANKDQPLDHGISTSLFVLHGLPSFWIGTLLIIFLGGGDFLDWFPPFGLGQVEGLPFWQALQVRMAHLAMPVFCLVYPILAYISRQSRGGLVNALHRPYITTARAKGLPERTVVWKHGWRNALLPLITLLGNILPFAISGSVIIEVVFSIPGMGKVSLDALYARDYPVVLGAVLLTALFTMLGYLLADILYAVADPRVNYKKRAL